MKQVLRQAGTIAAALAWLVNAVFRLGIPLIMVGVILWSLLQPGRSAI